jgi:hypothetical protein
MTDKILLVSPPDDVILDGVRLLSVDLNLEQSEILSTSLLSLNNIPQTIIYVWKYPEDINWLLDKSRKSDIIIFNAESEDQSLVGYFAGKPNSWYFGHLRSLKDVNRSVIYDVSQCSDILTLTFEKHGKTQR